MSMPASPSPDDRAERMVEDPKRYFADARHAEADVVARPPRRQFRRQRYDRPAPGVVQLRLTASCDEDIQAAVERIEAAGLRLWQAKDRLYEHEGGAVCRYYSTNLREQK